ncbi:MAG: DUF2141 domain-containing protein [Chlorobium limicola]|uniref:DUF2141 domain-containing protein n=1 Tax=Chlorobaculum thiosulfatiphilum TaxID=115852 RepID=A0A5C4S871_CHLTI|nr:DUF2141 domain-containing protein [Chlorobaculum thiosulfatiphilum]NTV08751.1 DUF2141 domain-containing protein [Chlorobium limicola]TNJ39357.1 DUF2141 domain-containing protein [Chlorobaculum thiosulfatiphilum]
MNLSADNSSSTEEPVIETGRIVVKVLDAHNCNGDLGIALFNDKHGFPGETEHAFRKGGVHEIGESNLYVFENVPYGAYAISVIHDEACCGELHKNCFGIPKEGVGASNNPHFFLGPPSFESSSFQLGSAEVEIEVHLKYLCG